MHVSNTHECNLGSLQKIVIVKFFIIGVNEKKLYAIIIKLKKKTEKTKRLADNDLTK